MNATKTARILGTIGFIALGAGTATVVVGIFAATALGSLSPCRASLGCTAAADVLLGLVMMAIVVGLPVGGWLGYRLARTVLWRAQPGGLPSSESVARTSTSPASTTAGHGPRGASRRAA